MTKTRPLILAALCLGLTACDQQAATSATTTKLDSIEVEPGTISDDMVLLDTVGTDGTAIDTSVPVEPATPDRPATKSGAAPAVKAAAEASETASEVADEPAEAE